MIQVGYKDLRRNYSELVGAHVCHKELIVEGA